MSQVTLFISAVSSEFAEDPKHVPDRVSGPGDYRTYLRDKLTGPDVLAVEYARRYRDQYTAVLMVNGESQEALDRELASLTGIFHLDVDSSTPEPQRTRMAIEWLQKHPGWLLVVDNVDSEEARGAVTRRLADWPNGHVLITGRVTRWPRDVEPLDLRVLSASDATRFLLEATQDARAVREDDAAQAELLANAELGALCLALEQASATTAMTRPSSSRRGRYARSSSASAWIIKSPWSI